MGEKETEVDFAVGRARKEKRKFRHLISKAAADDVAGAIVEFGRVLQSPTATRQEGMWVSDRSFVSCLR